MKQREGKDRRDLIPEALVEQRTAIDDGQRHGLEMRILRQASLDDLGEGLQEASYFGIRNRAQGPQVHQRCFPAQKKPKIGSRIEKACRP